MAVVPLQRPSVHDEKSTHSGEEEGMSSLHQMVFGKNAQTNEGQGMPIEAHQAEDIVLRHKIAARSQHRWFIVELLQPHHVRWFYRLWILGLVILAFATSFATPHRCLNMCGTERSISCPVTGWYHEASCIPFNSPVWRSGALNFDRTRLPHLNLGVRLVFIQPTVLAVKKRGGRKAYRIDPDCVSKAEVRVLDARTSQEISVTSLRRLAVERDVIVFEIKEPWKLKGEQSVLEIHFDKPPVWREETSDKVVSSSAELSTGAAVQPSFVLQVTLWQVLVGGVIFRYAFIAAGIIVMVVLITSHLRMSTHEAGVFGRHLRYLRFDYAMILCLHFSVLLYCDPLYLLSALLPWNTGLQIWSTHIVYMQLVCVVIALVSFVFALLIFPRYAQSIAFCLVAGLVSLIVPAMYCLFEVVSIVLGRSPTTLLLASVSSGGIVSILFFISISIVFFWSLLIIFLFFRNRNRIFYKRKRHTYLGLLRVRVMVFRVLLTLMVSFSLVLLVIILPLNAIFGAYAPGIEQSVWFQVLPVGLISSVGLLLWCVVDYGPQHAPPRVSLTEFDLYLEHVNQTLDTQQVLKLPDGAITENMRLNAFVDSPAINSVKYMRPLWQFFRWTVAHFRFLQTHGHAGYYFLTEADMVEFDRRHMHVVGARSFFCIETANACLSLSNEVYHEAPEETCEAWVQAQSTRFEQCLLNIIARITKPTDKEDKEVDEGKADGNETKRPTSNRPLDVEVYSYRLLASLTAANVQLIICEHGNNTHCLELDASANTRPTNADEGTHTQESSPVTTLASPDPPPLNVWPMPIEHDADDAVLFPTEEDGSTEKWKNEELLAMKRRKLASHLLSYRRSRTQSTLHPSTTTSFRHPEDESSDKHESLACGLPTCHATVCNDAYHAFLAARNRQTVARLRQPKTPSPSFTTQQVVHSEYLMPGPADAEDETEEQSEAFSWQRNQSFVPTGLLASQQSPSRMGLDMDPHRVERPPSSEAKRAQSPPTAVTDGTAEHSKSHVSQGPAPWEVRLDARAAHIIIAFRGTANIGNAVTDVNLGRSILREMRRVTRGRARVHAGFAAVWEQMSPHVMASLHEILDPLPYTTPLCFTGHSLGGALACLSAYAFKCSDIRGHPISVYTFGMPRIGNHTFRVEYNNLLPETYRVVCENDSVAEVGHCMRRHIGRLVHIDRDGNMAVEPSGVEKELKLLAGGGFPVSNHYLARYGRAMGAILRNHGIEDEMKTFLQVEEQLKREEVTKATVSSAASKRADSQSSNLSPMHSAEGT